MPNPEPAEEADSDTKAGRNRTLVGSQKDEQRVNRQGLEWCSQKPGL
jgi:hypothetical protein